VRILTFIRQATISLRRTEGVVPAYANKSTAAAFGALQGGLTMDRFGRKFTIQLGAVICLVGAILQTAAQNLAMMLVGRILAGWAVGLMSMSVPVYQAECAHPRSRGFIIGLSQQMIGIGFIVSTYVTSLFNSCPSMFARVVSQRSVTDF
jgi:MFS family permease